MLTLINGSFFIDDRRFLCSFNTKESRRKKNAFLKPNFNACGWACWISAGNYYARYGIRLGIVCLEWYWSIIRTSHSTSFVLEKTVIHFISAAGKAKLQKFLVKWILFSIWKLRQLLIFGQQPPIDGEICINELQFHLPKKL